jgi:hypothetical protein
LLGVGNNSFDTFSNTFNVVKTIGYENVHFGAKSELNILNAVPELGLGNIKGSNFRRNLKDN